MQSGARADDRKGQRRFEDVPRAAGGFRLIAAQRRQRMVQPAAGHCDDADERRRDRLAVSIRV
jgi:hypothetical protein